MVGDDRMHGCLFLPFGTWRVLPACLIRALILLALLLCFMGNKLIHFSFCLLC